MSAYPTALDSFTNPNATNKLNSPTHSQQHGDANDAITALETKLGISASTPSSGKIMRATGTGTSAWGALVNADVSASAAIAYSKLALTGSIVSADFSAEAYTAWTPTISAGGMGISAVVINAARYQQRGNDIKYQVHATFTTAAVAGTTIFFTAPVNRVRTDTNLAVGFGEVVDAADLGAYAIWNGTSVSSIAIRKYDAAVFGLGVSREIRVSGFYEL